MSDSGDDFEHVEFFSTTSSQEDMVLLRMEEMEKEKAEMKEATKKEKMEEKKKEENNANSGSRTVSSSEKKQKLNKGVSTVEESDKDLMERLIKDALQEIHAPPGTSLRNLGICTDLSPFSIGFEPISKLVPGQGCSSLITPKEIKNGKELGINWTDRIMTGKTLDHSSHRQTSQSPLEQVIVGSKAERSFVSRGTAEDREAAGSEYPRRYPNPDSSRKLEISSSASKMTEGGAKGSKGKNSSGANQLPAKSAESSAPNKVAEPNIDGSKKATSSGTPKQTKASENKTATGSSEAVLLTPQGIKEKKAAEKDQPTDPNKKNSADARRTELVREINHQTILLNRLAENQKISNEIHNNQFKNSVFNPYLPNHNQQPYLYPLRVLDRHTSQFQNLPPAPAPEDAQYCQPPVGGIPYHSQNNYTLRSSAIPYVQPYSGLNHLPSYPLSSDHHHPEHSGQPPFAGVSSNLVQQGLQNGDVFTLPYGPHQYIYQAPTQGLPVPHHPVPSGPIPLIPVVYNNCPPINMPPHNSGLPQDSSFNPPPLNYSNPTRTLPIVGLPEIFVTNRTPKWDAVRQILAFVEASINKRIPIDLSSMQSPNVITIDLEKFIREHMGSFIELTPIRLGTKRTFKVKPI